MRTTFNRLFLALIISFTVSSSSFGSTALSEVCAHFLSLWSVASQATTQDAIDHLKQFKAKTLKIDVLPTDEPVVSDSEAPSATVSARISSLENLTPTERYDDKLVFGTTLSAQDSPEDLDLYYESYQATSNMCNKVVENSKLKQKYRAISWIGAATTVAAGFLAYQFIGSLPEIHVQPLLGSLGLGAIGALFSPHLIAKAPFDENTIEGIATKTANQKKRWEYRGLSLNMPEPLFENGWEKNSFDIGDFEHSAFSSIRPWLLDIFSSKEANVELLLDVLIEWDSNGKLERITTLLRRR
ncbi:MAG: hypothetical protein AB7F43_11405 [Bacteriovoracia bacterium]